MSGILTAVAAWIIQLVSSLGFFGVFIGMVIESASIPLPSEIIMGIAGFLVYNGTLNVGGNPIITLILLGAVGGLGNVVGSTIMYYLGARGGRPIVKKYGKFLHITEERFDKVDGWFKKYGDKITFIAQLLPVVRTFVSLPLGILKVNYAKFCFYTFTGATIWCTLLAFISYALGEQWELLGEYMKKFEIVGIGIVLLGIAALAIRWIYKRRHVEITGKDE